MWNAFISSKNPFLGISLENTKERDPILLASDSDRSKKGQKETHSATVGTGENAFWTVEELFLNRKKASHNYMERQRMRSFEQRSFLFHL